MYDNYLNIIIQNVIDNLIPAPVKIDQFIIEYEKKNHK